MEIQNELMFKQGIEKEGYPEIENRILKFWEENKIFEKSVSERSADNIFAFYEGPPTANGKPGIHHVMSRTLKDLVCRYKTMQGYRVDRKGGWDTHGLPVEIEVEKKIGIKYKGEVAKYGIENYNENMTFDELISLSLKALKEAVDEEPTKENIRLSWIKGETKKFHMANKSEVEEYLNKLV